MGRPAPWSEIVVEGDDPRVIIGRGNRGEQESAGAVAHRLFAGLQENHQCRDTAMVYVGTEDAAHTLYLAQGIWSGMSSAAGRQNDARDHCATPAGAFDFDGVRSFGLNE
jgi:hypothetical protein